MPALLKVSDETCWDETGCNVDTGPVPDTGETGFSVQRGQGFSKIDSFNCAENKVLLTMVCKCWVAHTQ